MPLTRATVPPQPTCVRTSAPGIDVAALVDRLRGDDPTVRAAATEELRAVDPEVSRPLLLALLDHPSPDLRIRALDLIDRSPQPEVEAALIALLEQEPSANVCGCVLDLLAEVGTPATLPAIRAVRLRFADTPFIAFAADLALRQIAAG